MGWGAFVCGFLSSFVFTTMFWNILFVTDPTSIRISPNNWTCTHWTNTKPVAYCMNYKGKNGW